VGTLLVRGGGLGTMTLPSGTVSQWLYGQGQKGGGLAPAQAQPLLARVRGLAGVRVVVPVYEPATHGNGEFSDGLVPASDWARLGVYGGVKITGATADGGPSGGVVTVPTAPLQTGQLKTRASWLAGPPPAGGLAARPLLALLVTTSGDRAVERVRTVLQVAVHGAEDPAVVSSGQMISPTSSRLAETLRRMVDVGIILSLVIAGCSLAVAVAGGLIERKRPFSLLRLTGMPLAHLRRVVVLEAAVPLVLAALVSAAAGLLAADAILRATTGPPDNAFGLSAPSASYYLMMLGGVLAALAIVSSTLPLLGRLTEPRAVRME
jgi:hypothetical protein